MPVLSSIFLLTNTNLNNSIYYTQHMARQSGMQCNAMRMHQYERRCSIVDFDCDMRYRFGVFRSTNREERRGERQRGFKLPLLCCCCDAGLSCALLLLLLLFCFCSSVASGWPSLNKLHVLEHIVGGSAGRLVDNKATSNTLIIPTSNTHQILTKT